jgi:beta-glucanase (GH16 family)
MGTRRRRSSSKNAKPSTGLSRRALLGAVAVTGVAAAGYGLSQSFKPTKGLKFDDYVLTLSEEFGDPNFSLEDFFTRWYYHTPWWGDFGDAQFTDPMPGFPFTVDNGHFCIEARKGDDGKWRSGLIASINRLGDGFAQKYGYFEVRAKLPGAEGVWPAFWLDSWFPDMTDPSIEIDVFEYYGKFPGDLHSTVTVWPKDNTVQKTSVNNVHNVKDGSLTTNFHVYGVSVEKDWIVMYFDGVETWRTKTPITHRQPLMILVNLAMGSGWPIDESIKSSYLYIDYIRAYKRKGT